MSERRFDATLTGVSSWKSVYIRRYLSQFQPGFHWTITGFPPVQKWQNISINPEKKAGL
jgi:hypothetical protein